MSSSAPSEKLISKQDLQQMLGISRATFARWLADGRIPAPVLVMSRLRRYWRADDVQAWLNRGAPAN